jgi:mRNA interferase MazF
MPVSAMTRPKRGDVWWVDLEPTKGDEINKTRPAVVLSGDELGSLAVKLVAPVTSMGPKKVGKVWLVPIKATAANGLEHDSVVDVLQLRGVSLSRFRRRAGRLSDEDLAEVTTGAALVIGFE